MALAGEDFRSEIRKLAESAREELGQKLQPELPEKRERSRLEKILWIGGILILLEGGLLVAQLVLRDQPTLRERPPHPLQSEQSCRGAVYRTFQALVAYRRENGAWPDTLGELVGKYVAELPSDPTTGLPLVYSSGVTPSGEKKERLTLRCPKPGAPAS